MQSPDRKWKAELATCNQFTGTMLSRRKKIGLKVVSGMYRVHQLASALLTMVFAAAMLVVGHWHIEKRSTKIAAIPTAQAFVPWINAL